MIGVPRLFIKPICSSIYNLVFYFPNPIILSLLHNELMQSITKWLYLVLCFICQLPFLGRCEVSIFYISMAAGIHQRCFEPSGIGTVTMLAVNRPGFAAGS
jgi:ABC-type polysaccharide transport system permease subunit